MRPSLSGWVEGVQVAVVAGSRAHASMRPSLSGWVEASRRAMLLGALRTCFNEAQPLGLGGGPYGG